ncbi:MAG: Gfo/Idh/MocA family oxidoreductase [Melioribacteraceae bacterium]
MSKRKTIRFGIIGCGLMGREFAVASSRWSALLDLDVKPEIVGICDLNETLFEWYTNNYDSIKIVTTDYHELLASDDIDIIYCAVPHNLHEKFYIDIIKAGKHLFGEKPFGINQVANNRILEVVDNNPDVFVRCSSEFPFYPGAHQVQKFIADNPWGRIIHVNASFLHSSDINFDKTINWKRMININGEYGCMGDLGMHPLHIPIRAGWIPKSVSSSLSNIVENRPNGKGENIACETWDNATLQCVVEHPQEKYDFPMTVKTYRIAPGETNTWSIEILGTKFSTRFSTKYPKTLQTMLYENGGKQEWRSEDLGYDSVYKTITGGIFEFGFTDAILQMWASFVDEFSNRKKHMPYGCIRPNETRIQHKILTAALESHKKQQIIKL